MTAPAINPNPAPPVDTTDPADIEHVVRVLREQVVVLCDQTTGTPSTIRISAGDVAVEIGWHGGTVAGPAPVVASAPVAAPAQLTPVPTPEPEVAAEPGFSVCAETVGVFYLAPEPGAKPFVAIGDQVRPGQQIAIIEAMKLMIPVHADRAGAIAEVLVADGTSVEHGQPLFRLTGAESGAAQ